MICRHKKNNFFQNYPNNKVVVYHIRTKKNQFTPGIYHLVNNMYLNSQIKFANKDFLEPETYTTYNAYQDIPPKRF